MALKITPDDIIGGQAWWLKQGVINHPERSGVAAPSATQAVATQQIAEARKADPTMPTRTSGGGFRQPGMSESELNDFATQGNGEVVDLIGPKDMSKGQAQQVAASRSTGTPPEQVVNTPIDRRQRTAVDAGEITDPARQSRVNRLAEDIHNDITGTPVVDSYGKMLEYLKAQNIADADAGKRVRRREMMAAIGDGISAISSLYQTTQGAPVTYTYGKDMSQVMRDRYDRMMAQRKADSDKYLNYLKVQAARDNELLERQYKTRRLAADEAREDRENRRLDETERHNRELEKYYATKEQNTKEAKAAEQERKNNDSAEKNKREDKKADAYVAAQAKKGSNKSSSKKGKGNSNKGRYKGNKGYGSSGNKGYGK